MKKVTLELTTEEFKALKKAVENEQTRLFMLDEDNDLLQDAYQVIRKTTKSLK